MLGQRVSAARRGRRHRGAGLGHDRRAGLRAGREGDLYETMPSVRHGSEWAAGAAALAALLEPLASHPRAGTRQWSVRELGILRQRSSLGPLIDALDDGDEQVRVEARRSLEMLARPDPDAADVVAGLPELR